VYGICIVSCFLFYISITFIVCERSVLLNEPNSLFTINNYVKLNCVLHIQQEVQWRLRLKLISLNVDIMTCQVLVGIYLCSLFAVSNAQIHFSVNLCLMFQ